MINTNPEYTELMNLNENLYKDSCRIKYQRMEVV